MDRVNPRCAGLDVPALKAGADGDCNDLKKRTYLQNCGILSAV